MNENPLEVAGESTGRERGQHLTFIAALRGIAALLVVWDHIAGQWLPRNGKNWFFGDAVNHYVTVPFGVTQNFGFLGVAIFFLISGFIISYVAQRESRLAFCVKRIMRIYPPLVISIALVFTVEGVRQLVGMEGSLVYQGVKQVVATATLINYVLPTVAPINGVAWTLIIEVLFYIACLPVLPWIRSKPALGSFSILAASFFSTLSQRSLPGDYGDNWFQLSVSMSYLPVLVLGQLLFQIWRGAISRASFFGLSALAAGMFVWSTYRIYPQFIQPAESYGVSLVYAYAILVIALLLSDRIPYPRPVRFVSEISYSLYLTHGVIGFFMLDLIYQRVARDLPVTVAVMVVIAGILGVSYVSWRFIERPSQHLARMIVRRLEGVRDPATPVGHAS